MQIFLVALVSSLVAVSVAQRGRQPPPPPQNYPADDQQYNAPPQDQPQFNRPQPSQDTRQNNVDSKFTTQIPIIRFDKEQSADGSYKSSYETGNHIISEETGFLKNVGEKDLEALVQHGSYSYTAPDGQLISVSYTADEQGFRATGDHLPTPPPVPEEIQKSLDLIYAGIKLQQEQDQRDQQFKSSQPPQDAAPQNDNYPNRFRGQ